MKREDLERLQWTIIGSNGQTSNIYKSVHRGKIYIKKEIHKEYMQEYINEINCLKALQDSPHFPTLYGYNDDKLIIYMSFCGDQMYLRNKPANWKNQIQTIINVINEKNIVYSDVKQEHLRIYNDNTIRLIDFGRSTIGPQERKQDIHKIYNLAENVKYI